MFGLKTEVTNLLKLQEIDTAIDKNKYLLANLPELTDIKEAETQNGDLNKLKSKLEEDSAKEKQILNKQNDELDSLNQKIKKEEQKLFSGSIGNPKELASIQQEVGSLNNKRDTLETATLEQMDKVGDLGKKIALIDQKLSGLEAKTGELQATLAQKKDEINVVLKGFIEQRQQMAKTIDEELLTDYDDTRQRKDGIGAAALIDGICQACHVEVPETELEEIIKSERPDCCPNCGRILIIP